MKKGRILYLILAISIGAFLFIYAGIDDSPGGQMIGLLLIIIAVVSLIVSKRKKSD